MADDFQRIVLLNWLVSRSVARARSHEPPTLSLSEIVKIWRHRSGQNIDIEFSGAESDDDDTVRIQKGDGHNFIRFRSITETTKGGHRYLLLLIEHADQQIKTFPVIDIKKLVGREIAGTDLERGATLAHIMVRAPATESQLDLGRYRCVIEAAPPLTRSQLAHFLSRQLRRSGPWTFSVTEPSGRRGKPKARDLHYNPHVELHADVGRHLKGTTHGGKVLSQMVFTKRHEKQSIGQPASVFHREVIANVEYRISGTQAPADPVEQRTWIEKTKEWYTSLGYETRIYFKHPAGGMLGGEVHHAVAGAQDLIMCPKEIVVLSTAPKRWQPTPNSELVDAMVELIDRDELWERNK